MTKMDSEEIQQAIEAASAEIIERFNQMPVKQGERFLRGMRQMVNIAENYYLAQTATTDDAHQSFLMDAGRAFHIALKCHQRKEINTHTDADGSTRQRRPHQGGGDRRSN